MTIINVLGKYFITKRGEVIDITSP